MLSDGVYLFPCHSEHGWKLRKSTYEMAPASLILMGILSPVPMTAFLYTEQTRTDGKSIFCTKDNIVTKHCILILFLKIWRNLTLRPSSCRTEKSHSYPGEERYGEEGLWGRISFLYLFHLSCLLPKVSRSYAKRGTKFYTCYVVLFLQALHSGLQRSMGEATHRDQWRLRGYRKLLL